MPHHTTGGGFFQRAIDVLNFLIEASLDSDPEALPTHCIGMISTNAPPPATAITYKLEDGSTFDLPPLTLEYRRISLLDALDRITSQLGLTYTFEGNTLILMTKDGRKLIRKQSVEPGGGGYGSPAAARQTHTPNVR